MVDHTDDPSGTPESVVSPAPETESTVVAVPEKIAAVLDKNGLLNEETRDQLKAETSTFRELGVTEVLCEAAESLKWIHPSKIQVEAIPVALQGRDVIGLAETGSGKTGAFVIPILQSLLESPQRLYALILTPTRELAFQINEQVRALGSSFGVTTATIVGGMDMTSQAMSLGKNPHVVIATPGRLVDHLENTKGFSLKSLKFLVLDEADRILNLDFEKELDTILKVIPREGRRTLMFSATMTSKVAKLQRASLKDPVRVEVSSKYQTVENLKQYYVFVPVKFKDLYLVYILNQMQGNSFIIFCNTCNNTQRIALLCRNLGFNAIPLHGQMSQAKRLGSLNKFKSKARSILLATDVASRGLDIPHVDCVINFDIPTHSKDYIHRVGRTARAGRYGKAITLVSQYDVELYQRIEHLIGKKLPLYEVVDEEVMMFQERVLQAQRVAKNEMIDAQGGGKKRKDGDDDGDDRDDEEAAQDGGGGGKLMKKGFGGGDRRSGGGRGGRGGGGRGRSFSGGRGGGGGRSGGAPGGRAGGGGGGGFGGKRRGGGGGGRGGGGFKKQRH